jgi:MFS family permease
MALLTAALVEARHAWTGTAPLALFSAAALLLGGFAVIELRRRRPLVDPRLFGQPKFLASVTGAMSSGIAIVGLMSYAPGLMQRVLHLSALGSAGVLCAWSVTSMVVALAARKLPAALGARARVAIGLALCAAGEIALFGLGAGSTWTRLVPGLLIAGVGSGVANAGLGRLAVESVPPDRVGMGSGANNTARYLGGAAGVALVVSIVSSAGGHSVTRGWNTAVLVSAGLCAFGALIVASCRGRKAQPQTSTTRTESSPSVRQRPRVPRQADREFARPVVLATSRPTAHASSEAWPSAPRNRAMARRTE